MESMDLTPRTMKERNMDEIYTVDMKLDGAIGRIEPRLEDGERLHGLVERLRTDEFYKPVSQTVPSKCIDGRTGAESLAPNAAGGTQSLVVADDLTFKRFASSDGSTLGAYMNGLHYLKDHGLPVGGHTDAHAVGDASGCGANDRLADVYGYIAEHGDSLRVTAADLGVNMGDEDYATIVRNARGRSKFSKGATLLYALRDIAGEESVDPLRGDHREKVAVINTVAGTTLDRDALEDTFGPGYEAFNADVWSFPDAAATMTEDPSEIRSLVGAMTVYNLAVANVLCGPGMGVVVRR